MAARRSPRNPRDVQKARWCSVDKDCRTKRRSVIFMDEIMSPEIRALSGGALKVLLYLWASADLEGYCWPSQARISKDLDLTSRTVRRAFVELASSDLITKDHFNGRSTGIYVNCPASLR